MILSQSDLFDNENAHLQLVTEGTLAQPTAAAGSGAGTSPPAPVMGATAIDNRGQLTFGTGSGTPNGAEVVVTFACPFQTVPIVVLQALNTVTAAGILAATSISKTGFTISTQTALTASQANTVYAVAWLALG